MRSTRFINGKINVVFIVLLDFTERRRYTEDLIRVTLTYIHIC